jgi:hypothetical protein
LRVALPTTDTWDLADFSGATFSTVLDTSDADLSVQPSRQPRYFAYNAAKSILSVRSDNEQEAALNFKLPLPAVYTLQVVLRSPALPHNLGDLAMRRVGITVADDAGRGFTLTFAKTGVALSRVDHFGAVTALPDTSSVTASATTRFHTLRVAVDGNLGRAYVFVGEGETDSPGLRWILPVDHTPLGVTDTFRVFAKGTATEPVTLELQQLRLSSELVLTRYPPIANAGPDRISQVGSAIRLDGRASYDVDGSPLTYKWQCIEVPHGSQYAAPLSAVSTQDDGDSDGSTSFVLVAPDQLPPWVAAGDILRFQGRVFEVLFIDPSGILEVSEDSVPDNITAATAQLIRQNVLVDSYSPTPSAVPDVAGLYRFRLRVNDGDEDSEPSEVLANITPLQSARGIEPDVAMLWKALGDEWRFIEGRDVFEEAWVGVTQILAGKLLEAWQYHYNTSARDAQRVFQRKWVAYRTMIAEGAPDEATISVRHGGFLASYEFDEEPDAPIEGLPLVLEILENNGDWRRVTVPLGDGSLMSMIDNINAMLAIDDIFAVPRATRKAGALVPDARLLITGTRPFRLSGPACQALGLVDNQLNLLAGDGGSRITDRTYYVDGFDLVAQGVKKGDLLVLNSGESFTIDRVLDDPGDPNRNGRVLLADTLSIDTDTVWSIPSVVRSTATDYEREGAYPGDLLKVEVASTTSGALASAHGWVVGQKGSQLAVEFGEAMHRALLRDHDMRVVGVRRRKAIPVPDDVVSIPTLQEVIAQKLDPELYREHVHYVLEPFYRDVGDRPVPMLQFRDGLFGIDGEPADVLWAETTLFSNDKNIEGLFGRLVGFMRDDAESFPPDFSYPAGVFGLLYAQQRGPSLFAMSVGAQILLGQPFAEAAGYIEEIDPQYSPRRGRMLVRDDDGRVPTQSTTVRAYYYTKDPNDPWEYSGLAMSPSTNWYWEVGNRIEQFAPIGGGVDIIDVYTDPKWWRDYAGTGSMFEVEKFHRFVVRFNTDLVSLANVGLLHSLITRIKPTYTRELLVGGHEASDDIDVVDTRAPEVTLRPFDTMHHVLGWHYDDYKGDGHTSHSYDDGVTRYDQMIDNIVDTLEFCADVAWPGGAVNLPHGEVPFQLDTEVVDIDGTHTGTAGQSFTLENGMSLAAGRYRTCLGIKTGPVLPL